MKSLNLKNRFLKFNSLNKILKRDYTNNTMSFKPNGRAMSYFIDSGLNSFLYKAPYDFLKIYFINYSKINYSVSNFFPFNFFFFYVSCYFFSLNSLMLKQSFLSFFSFKFLIFHDFILLINIFVKLHLSSIVLKPTHFFSLKSKNIISFDNFILKVDYATFLFSVHIWNILDLSNIMNIFEIIFIYFVI